MQVNRLQIQSSSPEAIGDLGFKLFVASRDDPGKVARLWVRRRKTSGRHIWRRNLDPVAVSEKWEVRLHIKRGTGAMTLKPFSVAALDQIAEDYVFSDSMADLHVLEKVSNDDPLFNIVRDWVVKVTSSQGWTDVDLKAKA